MSMVKTMKKDEETSTSKVTKSAFQIIFSAIIGTTLLVINGIAIVAWSFAKKPILAFFKIVTMSSFAFLVLLFTREDPVPTIALIMTLTISSVSAMIVALLSK